MKSPQISSWSSPVRSTKSYICSSSPVHKISSGHHSAAISNLRTEAIGIYSCQIIIQTNLSGGSIAKWVAELASIQSARRSRFHKATKRSLYLQLELGPTLESLIHHNASTSLLSLLCSLTAFFEPGPSCSRRNYHRW